MSERRRLQQWVVDIDHDPGWAAWKVEDKYRSGLPDTVIKRHRTGRVSWLELKWLKERHVRKRDARFKTGLTAEQRRHLVRWGEGAYALVVVEPLGTCLLIPARLGVFPGINLQLTVAEYVALHDAITCEPTKAGVQGLIYGHLS